jgi:hypothetical protein
VALKDQTNTVAGTNRAPAQTASAPLLDQKTQSAEEAAYVPAPKSLINTRAAAEVAAVNTGVAGNTNAVLTSLPQPIDVSLGTAPISRIAKIRLATPDAPLKVGDNWRLPVVLNSDVPLGLAVLTLRFDPRVVAVRGVSAGTMFSASKDTAPSLSQSIDPSGICLISISVPDGGQPLRGAGVLLFIDIEALGAGDSRLVFDRDTLHLVATDARPVVLDLSQRQTTVKQNK